MEIEEVKDSAKTWFTDRLKNPYFASVIAVWLITNKVVVFGLFNFQENQSLDERLAWVQQYVHLKTIGPFHGFYGIILYSFLMGLVAMVAFNYLNVFGKIAYNKLGSGAVWLLKWLEPPKWIAIKEVKKMIDHNNDMRSELEEKKAQIIELKQEKEIAFNSISDLKSQNEKLNAAGAKNTELTGQVEKLKKEYEELEREHEMLLAKDVVTSASNENQNLEYKITNKINHDFEVSTFLKSDLSNYFDSIVTGIQEQKPITSVPDGILKEYLKMSLISIEKNLYILTSKGKAFYTEHLKRGRF
jgi:hypothetical protein